MKFVHLIHFIVHLFWQAQYKYEIDRLHELLKLSESESKEIEVSSH